MNTADRLERELTAWFVDTAAHRPSDYRDDILWLTAHTSQRSRWTSLQRWLPVNVVMFPRRRFAPFPWRTVGLLVVLAILLAAVAAYVGSRPRLPPPFGLAANGLVAYAQNGDIFTVDPATGVRQTISSGPHIDGDPRWSLDGTRLSFRRGASLATFLVIVDPKQGKVIATTESVNDIDPDSMAWSPDGRSIALVAGSNIVIADAIDGRLTPLGVPYIGLEAYWRPPDGRELLFVGGDGTDPHLFVARVDDGTMREIASPAFPGGLLRPSGWTPDGRRVVFLRADSESAPPRTHVVDLATGDEVIIDAEFAHVSNDGSRILALESHGGRMCIASIRGGPCVAFGQGSQAFEGTHTAGVQWSPDDEWIISRPPSEDGGAAVLVDPDGAIVDQPSWLADGGEAWQRVAP